MTTDSSFAPLNTENAFLPTSSTFPVEGQEMGYVLEQNYQRTANAVNARELAFYLTSEETLTGQTWEQTNPTLVSISSSSRSTFRKLVTVPVLAAGLNVIPHGIVGIGPTYMFTKFQGGIGSLVLWVPLPNGDINLSVDAVNLNVTIPAAYVGFRGYCSLEYLKDN